MFKIIGNVVNLFTVEGGTDKDGNDYDAIHKVQLMGKMPLQNGDTKVDLIDLKVEHLEDWKPFKNKTVSVDAGVYAPSKGKIIYFLRKGAKPQVLA